MIQTATFTAEPKTHTLTVKLIFSQDVKTDMGGTFDITRDGINYGQIEVDPTVPDAPFSIGFKLNTSIVNNPTIVNTPPVSELPSGQALPIPGLNRPLVKVPLTNDVNPNFDVFAYVDVIGKQWLGLAITLKFLDNKFFPAGLVLNPGYSKGKDGKFRIYGAVLGPQIDNNGTLVVPGCIALFADATGLFTPVNKGSSPFLIQEPNQIF